MAARPTTSRARPRIQGSPRASIVDLQHAVRVWTDNQARAGKVTPAQVKDFWRNNSTNYLDKIKSYFPIAKDVREGVATLRLIVSELGIMGKYYVRDYGGRQHIVFKGHAGARQFLTGTRYGLRHHKIISLKMTPAGVKAAARQGLIFGILFCTVIDVAMYFTNDRATLGQLFGTIGGDIAKCIIGTGAAYLVATGVAFAMGAAVIAIGPVVLGVMVGVGVSLALDALDNQFGVSRKLGELCDTGLARLRRVAGEIAVHSQETWRQIERSAVVRDLSREMDEWSGWLSRQTSRVIWHPGFL